MTAQIISGKAIAQRIKGQLKKKIQGYKDMQRAPALSVIQVGDDPASAVYVNNKKKACEEVGIVSTTYNLDKMVSEEKLVSMVETLNNDKNVDGILVQLPLPEHLDSNAIIEAIHPDKDVDGFHPFNIGRLAVKMPTLRPCTPKGIITMLQDTDVNLVGLDAVIIGASNIVGRPMALELLMQRCTVTVCHSATKNLQEKVAHADIVVAAVGKAHFIPGTWIKEGAIVIDVGINRLQNGKLAGDVDFQSAQQKAAWITPVPGGVGPMTVASLMENTLYAYEQHMITLN